VTNLSMPTAPRVAVKSSCVPLARCAPKAIAEALGCEVAHVNTMASTHKLPGINLGRSWLFPESALLRFFKEQATANLTRPAPVPSFAPIKKPQRGKPKLDLIQEMTAAGMSSEEQIALISEAALKSKPQQ